MEQGLLSTLKEVISRSEFKPPVSTLRGSSSIEVVCRTGAIWRNLGTFPHEARAHGKRSTSVDIIICFLGLVCSGRFCSTIFSASDIRAVTLRSTIASDDKMGEEFHKKTAEVPKRFVGNEIEFRGMRLRGRVSREKNNAVVGDGITIPMKSSVHKERNSG